jgi:excisionase family DNA binding protein
MPKEFFNVPESTQDTLHSIESSARQLGGISKYTVRAWLSMGKLRRTKIGRRTMIRESELRRFIEAGNQEIVHQ